MAIEAVSIPLPPSSGEEDDGASSALSAIDFNVTHTVSMQAAITTAAKALVQAASQVPQDVLHREASEAGSSFSVSFPLLQEYCAVHVSPRVTQILTLPSNAARASVEELLSGSRKSASRRRGLAVLVGIFAFARAELDSPASLSAPLARSAGWLSFKRDKRRVDAVTENTAGGTLADYLPRDMQYGRERIEWPGEAFVEVRSVVEYDALMDALFHSVTFQKIQNRCSLHICAMLVTLPSIDSSAAAHVMCSTWLLDPRHVEEFAATRTTNQPSAVQRCLSHLGLSHADIRRCRAPHPCSLMVAARRYDELLERSSAIHRLLMGFATASKRLLAPSRSTPTSMAEARSTQPVVPPPPPPPSRTAYSHTQTSFSDAGAQAERGDDRDSNPLPEGISAGYLEAAAVEAHRSSEVTELKAQLRAVGDAFDNVDRAFQRATARLSDEKSAVMRARGALQQLLQRADGMDVPRRSMDEQRKALILRLQELRAEDERVQRAAAASAASESKWHTERQRLAQAHEQEREAEIRRAAAELQALAAAQTEEEARVNLRWNEELRDLTEREEKLRATIRQDHLNAVQRRRDAEAELTARMADVARRRYDCDMAAKSLSKKKEEVALLEQQQRFHSVSVPHPSPTLNGDGENRERDDETATTTQVASSMRLPSALGLHQQLTSSTEALRRESAALTATLQEGQRKIDAHTTRLRELQEASRAAELKCAEQRDDRAKRWAAVEAHNEAHAADMRRLFAGMESYRRNGIMHEAAQLWDLLVAAEMHGWVTALETSEDRLMREMRHKCREDVFGVERRLHELEAIRSTVASQFSAMQQRLDETHAKHQTLRLEADENLGRARAEELMLISFLQDRPTVTTVDHHQQQLHHPTASPFPSLDEDEKAIRMKMERVRQALTGGAVAVDVMTESRRRAAGSRPSAPFAAQLAAAFRQTVGGQMKRLERLVNASSAALEAERHMVQSLNVTMNAAEEELAARQQLLERVVHQVATLEKQRTAIITRTKAAAMDLAERKRQQESLRRQLEDAFVAAKSTASQHQVDGQHHLRKLLAEEQDLQRELELRNSELMRMRASQDRLMELPTSTTTVAIELRIQREADRHAELERLIAEEEATLQLAVTSTVPHVNAYEQQQQTPRGPFSADRRISGDASHPKRHVVSPTPGM